MPGKYYITTAIPYASQKPHIGNSYDIVVCDFLARYKRQRGFDVLLLTGTDEHGQKVEQNAEAAGVSPQQYADAVTGAMREDYAALNISYDRFIRTTDPAHIEACQKIFTRYLEQDDIYKSVYENHYCVPCESFWTDLQLKDGCCPDCGRTVQWGREEAYFFRLSKYQGWLENFLEENPDIVVPASRKHEMLNNFIKPGLQDLCVTRSTVHWGIPVPGDASHVLYVWLDALFNYVTALGYAPDADAPLYTKYWPADVHVIGKDIVRFHLVYWPIFLHALGMPLPKKIFGHPWLLFGADKMSKTRGNVIYAQELAQKIGADAVRYFLLTAIPLQTDGSITRELVAETYNRDLANILGNLVSRCVTMANKYFGGGVPAPNAPHDLKNAQTAALTAYETAVDEYRIADAIEIALGLAKRANKYIEETLPWNIAKDPTQNERLAAVLFALLDSIRVLARLFAPVMPETAAKIEAAVQPDHVAPTLAPLFPRLDVKDFLEG